MNINDKKLDEYQQLNQYKIGYNAFIIILILLFIDNIVCHALNDNWVHHSAKFYFILFIPTLYFVCTSISKNIMNKINRKYQICSALICLVLAIALIIKEISLFTISSENYMYSEYSYIQNGILAENSAIIIQIIWLLTIGAYLLINYLQVKRELKSSEL